MPQPRTRSKAASTVPQDCPVPQLPPAEHKPPSLFILPQNLSPEARFVSLPNPATAPLDCAARLSSTIRYIFCPATGIHEITRVAAPRTTPRSCLIAQDYQETNDGDSRRKSLPQVELEEGVPITEREEQFQDGYIMEDADVFVATPVDPLFLLAPILTSETTGSRFLQASFLLDDLEATAQHFAMLFQDDIFQEIISQRLVSICQARDVPGDEPVYLPDRRKLVDELLRKAKRMTGDVWPASLEDAFIRKQLEVPVDPTKQRLQQDSALAVREEQVATTVANDPIPASSHEAKLDALCDIPLEIVELMRERTALEYLHESYGTSATAQDYNENVRERFTPLDEHLERVRKAKTHVQALRALSDNISRKRSAFDDDEAAEAREEKKRKKEEEEKRKKAESRAIKALKKVDTSGMKSIGSFFTKTRT